MARRAVAEGLFELRDDGITLLGGYSPSSGRTHFPRLDACPYTGARDVEPVTLADHGRLWGWTAVTAAPPGYTGHVPFGFGVVELPDGLRIVTRITEPDPDALKFGDPMQLVADVIATDDDGTEVVAWAFAPAAGRRGAVMSVEIAGIGMHPFGRFADRTVTEMGVHAVRAALEEAGDPRFDAAFCGTAYSGVAAGHKVLGALARTGMPIVDVEAGCASGGAALMLAAGAIRAGQYETVLVFGIEKMPKGIIRSSFFEPWREESGLAATPAYFALRAQRLLREAGLTKQHLAQVVVKNRRHGVHNPDAMFRGEVTIEQVLGSRLVCEPLHLWMLCSPNEGAAAVVLRAGGTAASAAPVTLEAAVLRSHLPGSVLGEATPLAGIDDTDIEPPTTLAATAAYEEAGIGPADIDVVECQDTDAARELLAWEELGLCAPGEQPAILAAGDAALGGKRPVNVSGGLLSKGEPLGASALGQVVELVRQLRGEAGPRQVEGARVGLAHTVGRGANASVTIVKRER